MRASPENGNATNDASLTALMALAWVLEDDRRAQRLLDLTGLDVDGLRAGADDPALLAAVITFLESYEPDLIACAQSLDVTPIDLIHAKQELCQ